jgi:hypothetical protein
MRKGHLLYILGCFAHKPIWPRTVSIIPWGSTSQSWLQALAIMYGKNCWVGSSILISINKKRKDIFCKIVIPTVRHCWKQNFLSNPRRTHSGKEDEEKEEQGLLWAVICPTPALLPPPLPHCASVAPPAATLSGLAEGRLLPLHTAPPPPPWLNLCDFQRPWPKARVASI